MFWVREARDEAVVAAAAVQSRIGYHAKYPAYEDVHIRGSTPPELQSLTCNLTHMRHTSAADTDRCTRPKAANCGVNFIDSMSEVG